MVTWWYWSNTTGFIFELPQGIQPAKQCEQYGITDNHNQTGNESLTGLSHCHTHS
jgi:hypothetical protein